jgi:hypothetical protein
MDPRSTGAFNAKQAVPFLRFSDIDASLRFHVTG